MMGGPGLRFALEAAFLIVLAVIAGLAELRPTTIVLVMGAAWLLVAAIEWLAWREAPRMTRREAVALPPPEPVPPAQEAEPRRRFWQRRRAHEPPAAAEQPSVVSVAAGEDTQGLGPPEEQPAPAPADERAAT